MGLLLYWFCLLCFYYVHIYCETCCAQSLLLSLVVVVVVVVVVSSLFLTYPLERTTLTYFIFQPYTFDRILLGLYRVHHYCFYSAVCLRCTGPIIHTGFHYIPCCDPFFLWPSCLYNGMHNLIFKQIIIYLLSYLWHRLKRCIHTYIIVEHMPHKKGIGPHCCRLGGILIWHIVLFLVFLAFLLINTNVIGIAMCIISEWNTNTTELCQPF